MDCEKIALVTSVGSGSFLWWDLWRKSCPRMVTVTQEQRRPSARIREATLSQSASRILFACAVSVLSLIHI